MVAVDSDPHAAGLPHADVAAVADIDAADDVEELAARHAVGGVLTVAADRTVAVVATVTERLGLPSIGPDTAHRFTHKLAMRRTLAEEGLPQPSFAAVRNIAGGRVALETVGVPAVLKPADAEGQRGLFRIDDAGDLESHLHAALAESRSHEAIVESFVEGTEMNAVVVARGGAVQLVTLSDRLRPGGVGFGVARAHLHPAGIHSDQLVSAERTAERVVSVLGLRDGIALVHLLATPHGDVSVIGAAARAPGRALGELVRHAVGVDVVDLALRFSLGEEAPDDVALPRFSQPAAIHYLISAPGRLPTGRVRRVGALGPILSAEGVVDAVTYLEPGTLIRPVRDAEDRHGYVLATGPTSLDALANADYAAGLVVVEVE